MFESFDQAIEDWSWNRNTKAIGNRLVTTMKNFSQGINFVSAKELLESIYVEAVSFNKSGIEEK